MFVAVIGGIGLGSLLMARYRGYTRRLCCWRRGMQWDMVEINRMTTIRSRDSIYSDEYYCTIKLYFSAFNGTEWHYITDQYWSIEQLL
jgi:hypothetical protein